jgi:hypothetical protein
MHLATTSDLPILFRTIVYKQGAYCPCLPTLPGSCLAFSQLCFSVNSFLFAVLSRLEVYRQKHDITQILSHWTPGIIYTIQRLFLQVHAHYSGVNKKQANQHQATLLLECDTCCLSLFCKYLVFHKNIFNCLTVTSLFQTHRQQRNLFNHTM